MSLFVRPTAPPRWLGLVVAASFIVVETIMVRLLMWVALETPSVPSIYSGSSWSRLVGDSGCRR